MSRKAIEKPNLQSGFANRELEKVEKQFDKTDEELASLTVDEMAKAPLKTLEPQTKMSKKEVQEFDAPVIRHCKGFQMTIPKSGVDPKFKPLIEHDEEFIKVICENNEVIGEHIELWSGNFPGQICGFYQVPVNIPVYVPRKVAKRIRASRYHRIKMAERPMSQLQHEMSSDGVSSQPSGVITVTETKQRLDCRLASGDF